MLWLRRQRPMISMSPLPRRMPLRCMRKVDLPAPLGPSRASFSPSPKVRSTPRRALTPSGYAKCRPVISTAVRTAALTSIVRIDLNPCRIEGHQRSQGDLRRPPGRVPEKPGLAVIAPRLHRRVDALAALIAAEEERAHHATPDACARPG